MGSDDSDARSDAGSEGSSWSVVGSHLSDADSSALGAEMLQQLYDQHCDDVPALLHQLLALLGDHTDRFLASWEAERAGLCSEHLGSTAVGYAAHTGNLVAMHGLYNRGRRATIRDLQGAVAAGMYAVAAWLWAEPQRVDGAMTVSVLETAVVQSYDENDFRFMMLFEARCTKI